MVALVAGMVLPASAVGSAAATTAAATTAATTPTAAGQATWTVVATPNSPGSNELLGAAGADATHVWAVGRVVGDSPDSYRSLILRWTGTAWVSAAHPRPGINQVLRGVTAPAPNDAWAVGSRQVTTGSLRTLVARWDGLDGEGFNARTLVLHWNGSTWTREATPSPPTGPKLFGAATIGPSTVWAIGFRYDQRRLANQTLSIRTTSG
jgi:hypothetical protein